MTGPAFMRYLRERTCEEHASWLPSIDPAVEMYDGIVRIHDQRGESIRLPGVMPRQLRAIATQLLLCADEIQRRSHEP